MTRPESPYPGLNYVPTIRAAAALPAGGAWDTDPLVEIITAGLEHLTLYVTYTRGAAGGAVNYRVEVCPYEADSLVVENWFQTPLYDAGALAPGVDVTSQLQKEDITFESQGAAAEMFIYDFAISGSVERLRVPCREAVTGDQNTPGTCHIVGVLW